ncbi:MAG: HAD hydrolase-like protein [Sphingobacteriales bacterium]|nr:HAD hydrolase-like protein [Sphingobacteriales bacterium]
MEIELVVFDIAGTTVTDKGNVKESFLKAFEQSGYPVPEEGVNNVMGYRKVDAIKMLLEKYYPAQKDNERLITDVHFSFTNDMIHFYEQDATLTPLPFAEETFLQLKKNGIKIALNTGFTQAITNTILKKIGWDDNKLIDYVISSDEVPYGRPHPFMIQKIKSVLNIKDSKAIAKVGDTEVDVIEGQNAGCGLVISVTTGAYTREQLQEYNPDFIIDSLAELPAILEQ